MIHLSPFLWIGVIFSFFQQSGKTPEFKQLLKKIISGLTTESSHIFSILAEIPSYPWDLLISKERILFKGSSCSKLNEEKEDRHSGTFADNLLLFNITEHCFENRSWR